MVDAVDQLSLCRTCGYDLRETSSQYCPECGRWFDPADAQTMCEEWTSVSRRWLRGLGFSLIVSPILALLAVMLGNVVGYSKTPSWMPSAAEMLADALTPAVVIFVPMLLASGWVRERREQYMIGVAVAAVIALVFALIIFVRIVVGFGSV